MTKILIFSIILGVLVILSRSINLPSQLEFTGQIGRNLLKTTDATAEAEPAVQTQAVSQIGKKSVTPTPDWSVRKVDEHVTEFSVPTNDQMSTRSELFDAVNSYRRSHNLTTLTSNTTICDIAQKRAEEQTANGGLDNHAGFNKYGQSQNEFSHLGEVLYGGQPLSGVHIVEFGWDRSLTGHKEALQNPDWQIGCGGISGYYAAFVFANN